MAAFDSCFIFPLFQEHSYSLRLPRTTRLLKASCFEKITNRMCNPDNTHDVEVCPDE